MRDFLRYATGLLSAVMASRHAAKAERYTRLAADHEYRAALCRKLTTGLLHDVPPLPDEVVAH